MTGLSPVVFRGAFLGRATIIGRMRMSWFEPKVGCRNIIINQKQRDMRNTLITIGIILLVVGLIGVFAGFYVSWMWVVVVLGVIAGVWGLLTKKQ